MKKAIVPEEELNAVMAYLGTRPYHEVFNLIAGIQSTAQPYIEPTPVVETTDQSSE
jgi:hypothetical protein